MVRPFFRGLWVGDLVKDLCKMAGKVQMLATPTPSQIIVFLQYIDLFFCPSLELWPNRVSSCIGSRRVPCSNWTTATEGIALVYFCFYQPTRAPFSKFMSFSVVE